MMRYLKTFENIDSKLYHKIKSSEYNSNIRRVNFLRKHIEEIAVKLNYKFYISFGGGTYIKISRADSYGFSCIIHHCEDEYFNIEYFNTYTTNFYKCDQMDGLLQFLKDENIIN